MSRHLSDIPEDPRETVDDVDDDMFGYDLSDSFRLYDEVIDYSAGYSLFGEQLFLVGSIRVSIELQMTFEANNTNLGELTELRLDICYALDNEDINASIYDANVLYHGNSNDSYAEVNRSRSEIEEELGIHTSFDDVFFKTFVINPTACDKIEIYERKSKRYTVITEHIAVDVVVSEDESCAFPKVRLIVYDLIVHSDPAIVYRAAGSVTLEYTPNPSAPTNIFRDSAWNTFSVDPYEIAAMNYLIDGSQERTYQSNQNNSFNLDYTLHYRRAESNSDDSFSGSSVCGDDDMSSSTNPTYYIEELEDDITDPTPLGFLGNDYSSEFMYDNNSSIFQDLQNMLALSAGHLNGENYNIYDNYNDNAFLIEQIGNICNSVNHQPTVDNDIQGISESNSYLIGGIYDDASQQYLSETAGSTNPEAEPQDEYHNSDGYDIGSNYSDYINYNFYQSVFNYLSLAGSGIIVGDDASTHELPLPSSQLHDQNTTMDPTENTQSAFFINDDNDMYIDRFDIPPLPNLNEMPNYQNLLWYNFDNNLNLNEQDSDELLFENDGVSNNVHETIIDLTQTETGLVDNNVEIEDLLCMHEGVSTLSTDENFSSDDYSVDNGVSDQES